MKKRLLTLAAAFALAASGSLVNPGSAQAAFSFDCETYGSYPPGPTGLGFQIGRLVRDQSTASGYDAVRADMTIYDARSCTNPDQPSTTGFAGTFINMDSDYGIVQLGYGRSDCPTGYTCAIPDNQLVWVYTPTDTSGGNLAHWSGIPAPVIGATYELRISLVCCQGGVNPYRWRMDIIRTSDSATWTRYITAMVPTQRAAFWMLEVHNKGDRLWGDMGDIAYSTTAYSGWIWPQYDTTCSVYPGSFAWWHICEAGYYAGTARSWIQGYTLDH